MTDFALPKIPDSVAQAIASLFGKQQNAALALYYKLLSKGYYDLVAEAILVAAVAEQERTPLVDGRYSAAVFEVASQAADRPINRYVAEIPYGRNKSVFVDMIAHRLTVGNEDAVTAQIKRQLESVVHQLSSEEDFLAAILALLGEYVLSKSWWTNEERALLEDILGS